MSSASTPSVIAVVWRLAGWNPTRRTAPGWELARPKSRFEYPRDRSARWHTPRTMDVDWTELRVGLARARPFLLSHHRPANYDRCYSPAVRGRTIRLCARCSGIYPGILAGLWAFVGAPSPVRDVVLVVVFPLPALLDWSTSALTDREGSNPGRTATGFLLGYGYGLGLAHLFLAGTVLVVLVGVGYGIVAVLLLSYHDPRGE